MKRWLFASLFVCAGVGYTAAQTSDIEPLKAAAKATVQQLNDYISFIADSHKEMKARAYYKNKALSLFINNGEPFDMLIECANGLKDTIKHEGAMIEIATLRNNSHRKVSVRNYLNGLLNGSFKPINIECVEYISDQSHLPSDPYSDRPTAYFVYLLYTNNVDRPKGVCNSEKTQKWYIAQLKSDKVLNDDTGETHHEYISCFGDIRAIIK